MFLIVKVDVSIFISGSGEDPTMRDRAWRREKNPFSEKLHFYTITKSSGWNSWSMLSYCISS
jgi:hypothetical protein